MKYITSLPNGGWGMDDYFKYLESVKDRMPSGIYDFASNNKNYDLKSHESLHDAWLECLSISEPSRGQRSEKRRIQIDCCYLGPYHDLKIYLTYIGVIEYSFVKLGDFANLPTMDVGHGDLLMHEVSLEEENKVIHELQFSSGSIFNIVCDSFLHRIEKK